MDNMEKQAVAELKSYKEGLKEGLRMYAWWKDGTQYVGTCGTTLQHALEEIEKEHPQ
jgi:exonuclease VII small subunit